MNIRMTLCEENVFEIGFDFPLCGTKHETGAVGTLNKCTTTEPYSQP